MEINCHGGLVSVNKVLQLILAQGVRLAEPGEFTKRAFKWTYRFITSRSCYGFDSSKTDRAMNVAINQMEGRLSKLIGRLRQEILETLAHVEVNIDYPEYDDVEEMTHNILIESDACSFGNRKILETSKQGKILREGIATAIIGRPNVGKSSLLNSLVQEKKQL